MFVGLGVLGVQIAAGLDLKGLAVRLFLLRPENQVDGRAALLLPAFQRGLGPNIVRLRKRADPLRSGVYALFGPERAVLLSQEQLLPFDFGA